MSATNRTSSETLTREYDIRVIEDYDGNQVASFVGTIGISAYEQALVYMRENLFSLYIDGTWRPRYESNERWIIRKGRAI